MSDSEAKRVPRIAEKTNSINERHVYPAYRLTFRLAKVLPADEPLSIPLLRLMMASNDVRHIQKLMLSKNEQIGQGNQFEEAVLNGEILHFERRVVRPSIRSWDGLSEYRLPSSRNRQCCCCWNRK